MKSALPNRFRSEWNKQNHTGEVQDEADLQTRLIPKPTPTSMFVATTTMPSVKRQVIKVLTCPPQQKFSKYGIHVRKGV